MDELQNEILESLPEDAESESSPEANPELEQDVSSEATEPQAETKEPPFNEHPRWKEVQEEKRVAQERADRLERQLLDISTKLSTPKEPGVDPYEGMDEEGKRFWKEVDRRADVRAEVRAKQERELWQKEQSLTRQQLAVIAYKEFQAKHPDVKANSPEENAIAKRVSQGYSPDDAYEIVVGSAKRKDLEEELARVKSGRQKAKTNQKIAANLESGTLSQGSPIQPSGKKDVRGFIDEYLSKQSG